MTKIEKQAAQLHEKIKSIISDKTILSAFRISDDSVQAELRLGAEWSFRLPVDAINFPKDLNPDHPNHGLWDSMHTLSRGISDAANLGDGSMPGDKWQSEIIKINLKTKTGTERRAEAKSEFIIRAAKQFMAEYRAATRKKTLARARKTISALQADQKKLIPEMRQNNSEYLSGRKSERESQKIRNAEALKSGRFWDADTDTLKGYFHPPFDKNYLADVSERWRASLFLECKSVSFKTYRGNWGHKLAGTGRGYLCGIDDNGDEWGFVVRDLPQSHDDYYDAKLDTTVEEAMSVVFRISKTDLSKCTRQGDLLFCPTTIQKEDGPEHCKNCGEPREKHFASSVESDFPGGPRHEWHACWYEGNFRQYTPHVHKAPFLKNAESWEPRPGHVLTGETLQHNGVYFKAECEIKVTHSSHASVVLPAGEYRLYMSPMATDED